MGTSLGNTMVAQEIDPTLEVQKHRTTRSNTPFQAPRQPRVLHQSSRLANMMAAAGRAPVLALAALCVALAALAPQPGLAQLLKGQVIFNEASGSSSSTDTFDMPSTDPPGCTDCAALPSGLSLVAYGGGGTSDTSKLPYYLSVTGAPGNTIFGVAAFGSDNCQGTPTNATFFNLQGDSFEVDPTSTFSQSVGSFFVCGATSG